MTRSAASDAPLDQRTLQLEIERCRCEIAEAERLLMSGHPDIAGLCLALSDWSAELRLLRREGT